MKTEEIVNQLKAILPRYTGDFTTNLSVSSLTQTAGVATATTATAHGLAVGEKVLIVGAKVPLTITSLTRVGNYVLAITSGKHPLIRGNTTVEISGANQSSYNGTKTLYTDKNHFLSAPLIDIESITISGTTATVTTKADHGYVNNANVEVQIFGASNENYNKVTTLNSVPTSTTFTYTVYGATQDAMASPARSLQCKQIINAYTFIFEVSGNPATPATGTITQLTTYKDGYNGYKTVVSVPTSTTFTYACTSTLGTPAQGTILTRLDPCITGAVDYERAAAMFQSDVDSGQANKWAVVVLGEETTSKNQRNTGDGISNNLNGESIRENFYQNATVYIFIPCGATNDELLYALTKDKAYSYKPNIFKALLGFKPSSNLELVRYSSLISVSNGMFLFNGSYYVHQYTFQANGWFNQGDGVEPDDVFAFRTFDFDVLDNEGFETSIMQIDGDVDEEVSSV
jgi:hypothetical protein